MSFNPSAAFPTFTGTGPVPNCFTVDASGSLQIGGASFAITGQGHTHAQAFGGNLCTGSGSVGAFTEYVFFLPPIEESPWDVPPIMLVASYRDLLVPNGFPEVPTGIGSLWIQAGFPQSGFTWGVSGTFAPVAINVEQPAPVPEPGTLTLFGLGLAAVARKMRSRSRGAEHTP